MKQKLIEAFGWYGTVAIIGTYALVSFGFMRPESLSYQVINLTGAIGIVVVSATKKVYQSAILNIIWSVIAIVAIIRILL